MWEWVKKKMAKTEMRGFSLIELLVVISVLMILAAIGGGYFLQAKRAANEASALTGLRSIVSSQNSFRSSFGNGQYGEAGELCAKNILDTVVCAASDNDDPKPKSGYVYKIVAVGGARASFTAYVEPVSSEGLMSTGGYTYGVTEKGMIYQWEGKVAPVFDETTREPVTSGAQALNK